jgi:hypothetical protein
LWRTGRGCYEGEGPDLGKDVESRACWDLGVYLSEIGKLDAKPETKQRLNYDRDPKNKDGLESKWQHAANMLVDDGTGKGTMVKSCVKAANTVRANCIMVPRKTKSDKCNQCQLAVMAAFFST